MFINKEKPFNLLLCELVLPMYKCIARIALEMPTEN